MNASVNAPSEMQDFLYEIAIASVKQLYPECVDITKKTDIVKALKKVLERIYQIVKSKHAVTDSVFRKRMNMDNHRDARILCGMLVPYKVPEERNKCKNAQSIATQKFISKSVENAEKTLDMVWDWLLPNWIDIWPAKYEKKEIVSMSGDTVVLEKPRIQLLWNEDTITFRSDQDKRELTYDFLVTFYKSVKKSIQFKDIPWEWGGKSCTLEKMLDVWKQYATYNIGKQVHPHFYWSSTIFDYAMQLRVFHHMIHAPVVTITAGTGLGKSVRLPHVLHQATRLLCFHSSITSARSCITAPRITPAMKNSYFASFGMLGPESTLGKDEWVYLYEKYIDTLTDEKEIESLKEEIEKVKSSESESKIRVIGSVFSSMNNLPKRNNYLKTAYGIETRKKDMKDTPLDPRLNAMYLDKHPKVNSPVGGIVFMTDGMLYEKMAKENTLSSVRLPMYHTIIIDEFHEHGQYPDLIAGLARKRVVHDNQVSKFRFKSENIFGRMCSISKKTTVAWWPKLVILSATLDDDIQELEKVFMNSKEMEWPEGVDLRLHLEDPIKEGKKQWDIKVIEEILESKSKKEFQSKLSAVIQKYLENKEYPNDILVFLPSVRDHKVYKDLVTDESCLIVPLDSTVIKFNPGYVRKTVEIPVSEVKLNRKNLIKKFLEPDENAKYTRRVIFATDIAEASMTFPYLSIVIDTGETYKNEYNHLLRTPVLEKMVVSRMNQEQRKGRVGRVDNGLYVSLYKPNKNQYRSISNEGLQPVTWIKWIKAMKGVDVFNNTSDYYTSKPCSQNVKDWVSFFKRIKAMKKVNGQWVLDGLCEELMLLYNDWNDCFDKTYSNPEEISPPFEMCKVSPNTPLYFSIDEDIDCGVENRYLRPNIPNDIFYVYALYLAQVYGVKPRHIWANLFSMNPCLLKNSNNKLFFKDSETYKRWEFGPKIQFKSTEEETEFVRGLIFTAFHEYTVSTCKQELIKYITPVKKRSIKDGQYYLVPYFTKYSDTYTAYRCFGPPKGNFVPVKSTGKPTIRGIISGKAEFSKSTTIETMQEMYEFVKKRKGFRLYVDVLMSIRQVLVDPLEYSGIMKNRTRKFWELASSKPDMVNMYRTILKESYEMYDKEKNHRNMFQWWKDILHFFPETDTQDIEPIDHFTINGMKKIKIRT